MDKNLPAIIEPSEYSGGNNPYLSQMPPDDRNRTIKLCTQYSEDVPTLLHLLAHMVIEIREVGTKDAQAFIGKYGKGKMHYLYEVYIRKGKREIRFDYHGCIKEWEDRELARNPFNRTGARVNSVKAYNNAKHHSISRLYDVLACVRSDAYCPDTWEDYKWEFGSESHEEYLKWEQWNKHAIQLRAMFTRQELEALPA